jgi:hypothetical protein
MPASVHSRPSAKEGQCDSEHALPVTPSRMDLNPLALPTAGRHVRLVVGAGDPGCGPCRPIDFASARPDGGNDKAVRLWMLPGGTPTNREGCLCRRHPDLTALGLQVCRRSTADPLVLTPVRLLDNTEDWRSERRCAPKSLILFAPIRSCSRFRWSDGCKVPRKNNNLAAPTRLKSPSNRHALAAHPPRDG